MNRPARLRYVNQLAGSFVLLIAALLLTALFFVARSQSWFVEHYHLHTRIAERDLDGLREGTEILLLGKVAGRISAIEYDTPNGDGTQYVRLVLRLQRDPKWPVYRGSEIFLRRHLAGAGDAYLEIRRGNQLAHPLGEGDEIALVTEAAPSDRLGEMSNVMHEIRGDFAAVRDSMVPAFEKMQATLEQLDTTNDELQQVVSDFQEFSPKLSPLADQTRELLADSQAVVDDFRQFSPRLAPLADQAQLLLDTSQEAMETIRQETEALPGTVQEFRDDLSTAQEVLDGLRSHWLLRRYVDQTSARESIAPAEVGRGGVWP